MLLEHLVYSFAVALIAGMIYYEYTGRDPSWLIIIGTIVPDVDYVLYYTNYIITGNNYLIIVHGSFHNILALVLISLLFGFAFLRLKLPFFETSVFLGIGMLCHFIEDALVYSDAYFYLYPFTSDHMGWGVLTETENILHVAGTEVLLPGLIILAVALCIRYTFNSQWSIMDYLQYNTDQLKYYTEILLNINTPEDD